MKKVLILIVVLVVVAAAAAGGYFYFAQTQAKKFVDEALGSIPNVKSYSHDDVNYSVISNKVFIPNLKLEYEKPQATTVVTDMVEIDKPDRKVIEKMLTAPEGAPLETVAKSITITGMKVSDNQVDLTVGDYKVDNLQIGSLAFLKDGKEFSPERAVKIAKATAVERVEMNDMKIVDKTSGKQVGTIKKMFMEDYNAGKLGKLGMEGFDIVPDDKGKITIKSISATNLDYSQAIGVIAQLSESEQPPTEMPDLNLSFGQIKMDGIDVTTDEKKNFNIASVTMDDFKQKGSILTSLKFSLAGLTIDVSQLDDPKAQQTLKSLGYDKVVLDAGLDYKWEAEAKRLSLKDVFLGGPDMGKLSLGLNLDGVDLSAIKNVNDLMGLMGTLVFTDAELSYADASLMERVLKMVAATQGTDPETMRQGLIQQLSGMQQMMDPTPEGQKMAETLVAFIKEPKSLLLSAKPEAPVPAMMLVGQAQTQPMELAKILNLTLSVNGGDAVAVHIPDMAMGMAPPSPSAPEPRTMAPAPMAPAPMAPAPEAQAPAAPAPAPGETQAKPAGPGGTSFSDMFKKSMPAPAQPDSSGEIKAQPLN